MPVDPYDPTIFANLLARYVTMAVIHQVVDTVLRPATGLGARDYLAHLSPEALNDPPRQLRALADDLVARSCQVEFAQELCAQLPSAVVLQAILGRRAAIDEHGTPLDAATQSLGNTVEPFLLSGEFIDFIGVTRHRVCAVRAGRTGGSGFLIGPDLVLTAFHVVEPLLRWRSAKPGEQSFPPLSQVPEAAPGSASHLFCIFDYLAGAIAAFDPARPPSSVAVARAHPDWLAWCSPKHTDDGVKHIFGDPPDIRTCFDCAIIRLEKPIGLQSTSIGGGRIRGWVPLVDSVDDPSKDEKIIVLQHPGGGAQQFDYGSLERMGPESYRMWYRTEALPASSGSPCFVSNTRLVAFHNAGYPTTPVPSPTTAECNQGVTIRTLLPKIPSILRTQPAVPDSVLWSVSDDPDRLRLVLGRRALREGIEALSSLGSERRILVVEDRDGVNPGRTGKSFSAEILTAMLRRRRGVPLLLKAGELLGQQPDKLLSNLALRLGLSIDDHPFPPRPTDERQITRWWATELPNWFGGLIEKGPRRTGGTGTGVSQERETASGGEARLPREPIWIVIDDLHRHPLEGGVRECIAGLVAVADPVQFVPPGIRALRWLLIGHVPDFVREASAPYLLGHAPLDGIRVDDGETQVPYLLEQIAASDIDAEDFAECVREAFISKGSMDKYSRSDAKLGFNFALKRRADFDHAAVDTYLDIVGDESVAVLRFLLQDKGVPV